MMRTINRQSLSFQRNLWWDRESESESIVFEKWESEGESIVLRRLRGRVFASGAASLCDLFVGAPWTMSSNCLSNVRSARPASASGEISSEWYRDQWGVSN